MEGVGIHKLMVIVLAFFLAFGCNNGDPIDNEDPRDLDVTVTLSTDGSGEVTVLAQAVNAVEFALYIDADSEPVDRNTGGQFRYTFAKTGTYTISVRAYGNSGRYVRAERQISVTVGKEVSVNDGYFSPLEYEGYDLKWSDEFEGPGVKPENWVFEIGTGCPNCGWGNNELQYYRRENASVNEGVLIIEARAENYQNSNYTSARMVTRNLHAFKYGRIDIRALLPQGQGIWPALWMLGKNFPTAGWPSCGEIDIMEMIGGDGRENTVHGTLHWDHQGSHAQSGGSYRLDSGRFSDEYHVFSILWSETEITWLLNNKQYYSVNITPSDLSEFHQEFFFIMNVAVGGNWPGKPNTTTQFPQQMKVDYLRVFQKQN